MAAGDMILVILQLNQRFSTLLARKLTLLCPPVSLGA